MAGDKKPIFWNITFVASFYREKTNCCVMFPRRRKENFSQCISLKKSIRNICWPVWQSCRSPGAPGAGSSPASWVPRSRPGAATASPWIRPPPPSSGSSSSAASGAPRRWTWPRPRPELKGRKLINEQGLNPVLQTITLPLNRGTRKGKLEHSELKLKIKTGKTIGKYLANTVSKIAF